MPYLLHDRDTPYNQWHQQRVLTQPSANTTVELFALVTMTDIEQAQALLTRLAKRRNPLDALRQTNQHELQKLPLTPQRAGRVSLVPRCFANAAIEFDKRL